MARIAVKHEPCVYGIFDAAEPDRIRYVGLTRKGTAFRLRGHWKTANNTDQQRPILFWLRKRAKADVEIRVLEIAEDDDHMNVLERFWIAQMRALGQADLNLADGGESSAGWHHSQEYKDAIAIRMTGAGSPTFGAGHTDETRALMSIAAKARTSDPEWQREHGAKVKLAWESPALRENHALNHSAMTVADILEIRRLRDVDGLTFRSIVAALPALNLSEKNVAQICRRTRWAFVPDENPEHLAHSRPAVTDAVRARMSAASSGSKHWKTSLTEEQVEIIKHEIWSGQSHAAIGANWGLGKQAVSHISKGSSWKNVPWPIGPRAISRVR